MTKKPLTIYWIIMALGLLALCLHIIFQDNITKIIITLLPPLGAGSHAVHFLGKRGALQFFIISVFTGFTAEYLGLKFGVPFGGNYFYTESFFAVLGVPIYVLLFWFVFIYTAHCISDIAFPTTRPHLIESMDRALKTSLLVILIDLILDPLMVAEGIWEWTVAGVYFGIPLGNFIGWALVGFTGDFIFRATHRTDYYFPSLSEALPAVVTYNLMLASFSLLALLKGIKEVAVIGFFIFSLSLFFRYTNLPLHLKKILTRTALTEIYR